MLYTNTNLVSKVTQGDLIEVQTSNKNKFSLEPENTQIYTFRVKTVDIYDKIIEIESNNLNYKTITVNSLSTLDIANTSDDNVTWIIKNPSLGLFGSYQHSQAMIDAMKINDFYNNFF